MASTGGPQPPQRKHARVVSADLRPVSASRRMTTGPLDLDFEPPQVSTPEHKAASSPSLSQVVSPISTPSAINDVASPPASALINVVGTTENLKDYSYLLEPQLFRQLSSVERTALSQLSLSSHLSDLASQSASLLPQSSPTDSTTIFTLWYIRLSTISLISPSTTTIASTEIKVFGDLTSSFYRDPETNQHSVPWELRVLAIRLQALGFNDWRRCLEHFYILAKEARAEAVKARKEPEACKLWKGRLLDIGIRIVSALIEMGDFDGAERHLRGLLEGRDELDTTGINRIRQVLLFTQLGQLDAARECYQAGILPGNGNADLTDDIVEGCRLMAVDDYEGASFLWKRLYDENEGNEEREMYAKCMATSLLYLRRLPEVQSNALKLSAGQPPLVSLTFNLATLNGLCELQFGKLNLNMDGKIEALTKEMGGIAIQ